ncbi:hypothetical protein N6H05_19515 [Sphingobium sp. WTD-1]|uniref:hypothetical protein n=1 Tax=Sphingobium sp. WTD-1 TaxID=2979467 RepID=UPI0024DE22EF|nr:hypothetical protein [Sphingobium sp. WTD-1]WIA55199.1 hypothetical protein N6H05_19515 [Sphingobium sp. WTD-1]
MAEDRLEFNLDGDASGAIRQLNQFISAAEGAERRASTASNTIRNALGSINNVRVRAAFLGNLPTESQQATTALNGTRQALQSITGIRPQSDPLGSLPEDAREAQAELARLRRELEQIRSQRIGNPLGDINPAPVNRASGALGTLRTNAVDAAASMNPLGGSIMSLGSGAVAGATLAVGAAIVGVGAAALSAGAKVESYKASLTTVVGDADRAGVAFQALARFAQDTPFSLDQAIEGFVKLKALGLTRLIHRRGPEGLAGVA